MPSAPILRGRADELAALRRLVGGVAAGVGGCALVQGEPGIGKSRLLDELLLSSEAATCLVLRAAGQQLERDRPFGLLADALQLLAAGAASPDDMDAPFAQHRVAVQLVEELEKRAAERPLLVLLDDVHWADRGTLLVIGRLVRRLAQVPLALVLAMRPAPRSPELAAVCAMAEEAGATSLELAPLSLSACEELLRDGLAASPGPGLCRAVAGAGGNPLFLLHLVAALEAESRLRRRDGCVDVDTDVLPPGLRLTVLRRLAFLEADAVELLRTAAVLGFSFRLVDLARVTGRSAVEAARVLEDALRTGLLESVGDELRFRHDVVREAVYEDVPRPVRLALHAEAGAALAAGGAPARLVAQHLALAARPGDREAAGWLLRAAEESLTRDPAVAVQQLEQARALLVDDDELADETAVRYAQALILTGRLQEGRAQARRALATTRDASALARLHTWLVHATTMAGRPDMALDALPEPGLVDAVPAAIGAELLAVSGFAQVLAGRLDEAERSARRAWELASDERRAGPLSLAAASLSLVALNRGRAAEAARHADTAIALLEQGRDHGQRHVAALAWSAVGRSAEATALLVEGVREAERSGAVSLVPVYHDFLAVIAWSCGDWDTVLPAHAAARIAAAELGVPPLTVASVAVTARLLMRRDDLVEARTTLHDGLRVAAGAPAAGTEELAATSAALALAAGDVAGADAWLSEVDTDTLARTALTGEAELVRRALLVRGPTLLHAAADALDVRGRGAEVVAMPAVANHLRGLADGDADRVLSGVVVLRDYPRPLLLANALEDAGRLLLGTLRQDEGAALLDEALDVLQRLGSPRDASRVLGALRAAGVRRGVRGVRGRPASGWDSLTDAEERVVRLVADGLSNGEIAARLFLSKRTVESHVARLFRKLEVGTRAQLMAAAARRLEPQPVAAAR